MPQLGRRSLIVILAVTPILALMIVSILFNLRRSGMETKVIETYIQSGSIDLSYRDSIVEIANRFAKNSRFEGRVNTTHAPITGDLNIYMLEKDPFNAFADIKCNCAFIGEDIILCDKAFFETFARSLDYSPDQKIPVLNEVNKLFYKWLGSWLLGHEIGHAVLHSSTRGKFGRAFERSQEWQAKENEADEFVIAHIDSAEIQKASFAFTNLVFQIYTKAYSEQQPKGPVKIKVPPDRIHGPWVQRAINMGARLEEHSPGGKPKSDFFPSLSSNFSYTDDGYDVGRLCDGIKIRGPNN